MVDTASSTQGMQCLKPTASNTFEQLRPRKKARRSCLNCQRSHKTCGNERPCESCCKRGMALKCVDGFRKPPKYLCDEPPKPKKTGLHRTRPCRRQPRHEFIDPTLLQTGSPSPEHDSSQAEGLGLFWDEKNNALSFSRKLQQTPWETVRSENCEKVASEEPYQSPEDVSDGLFPESLAIGTLIPPVSNVEGCNGLDIKEVHGTGSSYGIAISSGWSSTFFPCGMEEEIEEAKAMAMAVGGTESANFLTWGQGMGEGNRASWLL